MAQNDEPDRPSQATIKRLFALSGNRCAFRNCNLPIVQGQSLVGDVCHIKAASPKGKRYDPYQSAVDRHAFENLILMCPNHHRVIDDDEEAYTVTRLRNLKADHEARMAGTPIDDPERAAQIIFDASVRSVNQSGGVTAQTINATNFHVGAAPRNAAADTRTIEAIDKLWNVLVRLKRAFSAVVVLDAVTTREELEAAFRGNESNPFVRGVDQFISFGSVIDALTSCGIDGTDAQRAFVSHRLYSIFFALQAVYARSAMLIHKSFEKGAFRSWREDNLIDQHAESIMQAAEWQRLKQRQDFNLMQLTSILESTFLAEAEKLR